MWIWKLRLPVAPRIMLTNEVTSISQYSFNSCGCVFRVVKSLKQGSSIFFQEESFLWTVSRQRTAGAMRARPDSLTWGESSRFEITSLWASVSLLKYCCLVLRFVGTGWLQASGFGAWISVLLKGTRPSNMSPLDQRSREWDKGGKQLSYPNFKDRMFRLLESIEGDCVIGVFPGCLAKCRRPW